MEIAVGKCPCSRKVNFSFRGLEVGEHPPHPPGGEVDELVVQLGGQGTRRAATSMARRSVVGDRARLSVGAGPRPSPRPGSAAVSPENQVGDGGVVAGRGRRRELLIRQCAEPRPPEEVGDPVGGGGLDG